MAILVSQDSAEGKERAKWEQDYENPFGLRPIKWEDGGRYPRRHEEYPKRMYKAGRPTHGNVVIEHATNANDAREQALLEGQGYRAGQQEAIDAVKAHDTAMATAAANRAYHEARMSPAAQAEAQAFDQQSVYHQPEIPAKPKRGRRPKPSAVPIGG